jgi:hypothetical protein
MFSARLTDPHRRWGKRAFDAVVVDEAQDVGIPELRFLAIAGSWRADGLLLTGDLGQRIFQQPFSWKSLGIDIRGRSYMLRLRQAARIAEIIIVKDRHGRVVVRVHWGAARMRFENLIQEHDSSEWLLPDTPRLDGSRTLSARAVHGGCRRASGSTRTPPCRQQAPAARAVVPLLPPSAVLGWELTRVYRCLKALRVGNMITTAAATRGAVITIS